MKFTFLNTKIDLSQLKAGVSIDKNNELLIKYDKNNNSIFDSAELDALYQDLTPYVEDGKLDKNEATSFFAQIMNLTSQEAEKMLYNDSENDLEQGFKDIIYRQAQEDAIKTMKNDYKTGLEMYESATEGVVSKGINYVKEGLNHKYAGDKIYRQLAKKQIATELIEASQNNNLTRKEYVEKKLYLLKFLLGNNLTESQNKAIEEGIKNCSIQDLDNFIQELANAEDADFAKTQKKILEQLTHASKNNNNFEIGFKTKSPNSIESLLKDGDKKLSFNDVYKFETGCDFNSEKVQEYNAKQEHFNIISTANNAIVHQYQDLEGALDKNDTEKLLISIKNTVSKLYGNNSDKIQEFYNKFNTTENDLNNLNNEDLKKIAQTLQEELKINLDKALGGKSIDEHLSELKNSYENAFGTKNCVDLAQRFAESQEKWLNNTKLVAAGVGMLATFGGGGMAIVGLAISTAGGAGISFIEESSKSGKYPKIQKKKSLMN